jgi:hypothetical protein
MNNPSEISQRALEMLAAEYAIEFGYSIEEALMRAANSPSSLRAIEKALSPLPSDLVERVGSGMESLSAKLSGLIIRDGGPPKVKLPSGAYLEGEGAAAYIELVEAVSACFDRARTAIASIGRDEGWQDIASAPVVIDQEILGFAEYYGKPVRFVAVWNGLEWYAGWGNAIQPTHWRPLPDPPSLKSQGGEKGE